MAKISNEEMLKDLDFKCARCQAECVKVNSIEPEYGYMSHAPGHEGEFVGPLCADCFKKTSPQDQLVKTVPETAFLMVIKQNGEGAYVTTEGVGISYIRDATSNDIMNACERVSKDIEQALFAQKLSNQIVRTFSSLQKQQKILVPR